MKSARESFPYRERRVNIPLHSYAKPAVFFFPAGRALQLPVLAHTKHRKLHALLSKSLPSADFIAAGAFHPGWARTPVPHAV
jgi:hypothetical protein